MPEILIQNHADQYLQHREDVSLRRIRYAVDMAARAYKLRYFRQTGKKFEPDPEMVVRIRDRLEHRYYFD